MFVILVDLVVLKRCARSVAGWGDSDDPAVFPGTRLKGFTERYPDVDLYVREGTTSELVEQVLNGMIDVAMVSLPVHHAGLVMKELFRESLYLAVPKGHPLASEERVQLRRLSQERLLILKDGHCLRDETLAVCDRRGHVSRDNSRWISF